MGIAGQSSQWIVAVAMTVVAGVTAHAQVDDNTAKYFEITGVVTKEIPKNLMADYGSMTAVPDGIAMGTCNQTNRPFAAEDGAAVFNPIEALDSTSLILDKIVNLGRKVWDLVQAGKPVLNIQTDVATGLPQGTRCWLDLQTWAVPESRVYSVAFRNGFGMDVVKLSYRVLWLPGGSVDGAGKYIGYAAIVPTDSSVSWGFNLNAKATVPMVFNMGTKVDPVAGMNLSMIYRVETPFQTSEQSQSYYVNGKGEYKQLD